MSKEKKVKVEDPNKKKESFMESKAFKSMLVKLYGLGAAVVILGALFKIQHWKGAGLMLIMGLSTEAFIFSVSAFDPAGHKQDVDWSRVYPELAGDEPPENARNVAAEISRLMQEASIDKEIVVRMGDGLHKLVDTIGGLRDITNAQVATEQYSKAINSVTESVVKINESYQRSADSLASLSESSATTKEYFGQMKTASLHLASLNSVYEMEINNTNRHSEALGKYQATISKTIQNLVDAETATIQLKDGFEKLNKHLSTLNTVYGNMLTAMGRIS
jgi:gliding motility-associated protein GldL